MAEVAERSTVEVLKAARERITPPGAWITGTFARNEAGWMCPVDAPTACKWCVEGSLAAELLAAGAKGGLVRTDILVGSDAYGFLLAAAHERSYEWPEPSEVNDRYGHAVALAMCDRAVQLAEQEATNAS